MVTVAAGGRGQAFSVLRLVGKGRGQRYVHGRWGVDHGGGAVQRHGALTGGWLGERGDGQRCVAVRIGIVGQRVEGDRHAEAGTAGVSVGDGCLILSGVWCRSHDHHGFGVTAAGGGLIVTVAGGCIRSETVKCCRVPDLVNRP